MTLARVDTYTQKRKGSKHEPWGTPVSNPCVSEATSWIFTNCERPLRYDWNQFRTRPVTPNVNSRRRSSISCRTQSNAALMSSNFDEIFNYGWIYLERWSDCRPRIRWIWMGFNSRGLCLFYNFFCTLWAVRIKFCVSVVLWLTI